MSGSVALQPAMPPCKAAAVWLSQGCKRSLPLCGCIVVAVVALSGSVVGEWLKWRVGGASHSKQGDIMLWRTCWL